MSEERALHPLAAALGVLGDFHDVVYAKDRDGRYLMANVEAARVAGVPEDAMIGRTDVDLFGVEGERIFALDEEILASGSSRTVEEVIVVEGEPRTYLTSKAPLRDPTGHVIGLVATSTDITARAQIEEQLRRREAQLADAQRVGKVGSWEWDMVRNAVSWSPELYELFRVDETSFEATYEGYLSLLPPEERERLDATVRGAVERCEDYEIEHTMIRPGGERRSMLCRGSVLSDIEGTPTRLVGAAVDVTDYRRAVDEAIARQAQLVAAEELTGIGSFVWDLDADELVWSEGLYRIFGRDPAGPPLASEEYFGTLVPDEERDQRAALASPLESGDWLSSESRLVRDDGEEIWLSSRVRVLRDGDGRAVRMIGACQDVTERRRAELALREEVRAARGRALLDPLTGLANRTLAYDRLQHALTLRERRACDVGVLFVDLDHFKQVNDRYGHAAGDEVLAAAARRLREAGRESDTVARIGGDEFLVVCEDIEGAADARALAERLRDQFIRPLDCERKELELSISVGVSLAGNRDVTPDDLIREADSAMYRAKADAGSAVSIFEPAS